MITDVVSKHKMKIVFSSLRKLYQSSITMKFNSKKILLAYFINYTIPSRRKDHATIGSKDYVVCMLRCMKNASQVA